MDLARPFNFRDVDNSVNCGSYSSTRDKGNLIVRSARKAMGPNSSTSLDSQVTERECLTAHLRVLQRYSAVDQSDSMRGEKE